MKTLAILLLTCFTLAYAGCSNTSTKTENNAGVTNAQVEYTCPMHPEVMKTEPGNCPKCGMELVKKDVPATDTTMHVSADSMGKMERK